VTDKPLSRRELVNRLKEFVCGATGSGSVVWGDEMLLKEYAAIVQSEKGMSAEEIDRVVSDLGRVAGVGDLYDRALGAIGDLRQQHASNDAATDKLIDALVAMVERNGGKMVNLPGWDGVSLAFHEHPRSHVERNAADSRRTNGS
jgi:hypothetical protein